MLCNLFLPYLTGIFFSTAVTSAKHSGSDHVAIGANAGFLTHQADVHLLKGITGLTWGVWRNRLEWGGKHINLWSQKTVRISCCPIKRWPLKLKRDLFQHGRANKNVVNKMVGNTQFTFFFCNVCKFSQVCWFLKWVSVTFTKIPCRANSPETTACMFRPTSLFRLFALNVLFYLPCTQPSFRFLFISSAKVTQNHFLWKLFLPAGTFHSSLWGVNDITH